MDKAEKKPTDNIDQLVDDVFGRYCVNTVEKAGKKEPDGPTFIVKKSRIGVVLKRDNSLALLYQNKKRTHKGKVVYPIEIRNIGKGKNGITIQWMEKGSFSLL